MPGKAIDYGRFKKILDPSLGYDFHKVREELLKLKDMDEAALTDEMKAVRQAYFENRYQEACISEKLDMLSEDVIRLVHENSDRLLAKDGIPPHVTSLIQSMMRRENERAELILRMEQVKLMREIHQAQNMALDAQQLSTGFLPQSELGEALGGEEARRATERAKPDQS